MRASAFCVLAAVSAGVFASPIQLEIRQSDCAPLMHIAVAGTFEHGLGLTGTAMQEDLPPLVPGATVQPLYYDTLPEYYITTGAAATKLAKMLTELSAQCPSAKFSLSGYSKGAMVLHQTVLSADVQAKVVSAVVFGDPNQDTGSQGIPINNVSCYYQYCVQGDTFCDPPGAVDGLDRHLSYADNGDVANSAGKIAACYEATQ